MVAVVLKAEHAHGEDLEQEPEFGGERLQDMCFAPGLRQRVQPPDVVAITGSAADATRTARTASREAPDRRRGRRRRVASKRRPVGGEHDRTAAGHVCRLEALDGDRTLGAAWRRRRGANCGARAG